MTPRLITGELMTDRQTLAPARQLAETNKANFPNESTEYRAARNALLVEEIELRRHIERVASQRRALPPGGRLPQDFELVSEKARSLVDAVRRQRYADGLQHDVRSTTQGAMSHVHIIPELLERDRRQSA